MQQQSKIKMSLIERYKHPTPWKFRKIGNFALLMAIIINFAIISLPENSGLSPIAIKWLMWGNGLFAFSIKTWTDTMRGPVPSAEDIMEDDEESPIKNENTSNT